jgi:hypothetical protein
LTQAVANQTVTLRLVLSCEDWAELKAWGCEEERTGSSQARHLLRQALRDRAFNKTLPRAVPRFTDFPPNTKLLD